MTDQLSLTRRAALAMMGAAAAYSAVPAFAQSDEAVALQEMTIGAEDAPITMVEYASFTCPHCKNFHHDVLPQIMETISIPAKFA